MAYTSAGGLAMVIESEWLYPETSMAGRYPLPASGSGVHHAAVDEQGRPGDVAGQVAGEQHDAGGDVVGRAGAAQSDGPGQSLPGRGPEERDVGGRHGCVD